MATSEQVAIELIARVDGFDGKIKQSAASFGTGMKQIEASASRAENSVARSTQVIDKSMSQAAQRSRNLGFQISDIGAQLAGGQSPFLILAQQAPQVANALDGAKGAVGRFATFLSGPWGAAMLAAGTLLGVMASKYIDLGSAVDDAVDKLKESADKTRDANAAQEIFANTLDGVEAALRENEEALRKLNLVQDSGAESAYKAAEAARQRAIRIREITVALLEQAKAEYAASQSQTFGAAGGAGAGIAQSIYAGRVSDLDKLLERANAALETARKQTVEARANVIVERELGSKVDQINRKYDERIDAARKLAIANGTVETSLQKQVKAINAAREADLKRYRDTQREANKTSRSSGLPAVTGAEIAAALGTTITSGQRSAAKNKSVGGGKNSYHLTGQAIDIPLTVNGKPLTKAGIRAVLEPLGVQIKELLGPGDKGHNDHFHIAFDKKRAGPDKIAENQQRAIEEAERSRLEEERRVQSFQNELAALLSSEVDARQALVTSAEELARLELESIEIARQKYADNLESLKSQKKLTDEEAAQLSAINEERAKLRTELVKRREDERKFRMAEADRARTEAVISAQRDIAAELTKGELDLATTQKERRALEMRLLELQYQEERARNDFLIGQYERLRIQEGITESELSEAEAQAEIARLRNETIEARQANDQQGINRDTQSPLQGYFDSIPSSMDEINEALESVAAGGLATFTDALTDAIVNFTSLKDVGLATLQAITAGLVRMAIQQVLLRTIGNSLGQAATAATTAQASAAAAAWAPAAALASLATLGSNAGPAAAALATTTALSQALAATSVARKDGGPIFGAGGPRDDKVLMRASPGEYVIKASSAAKLGMGALNFINERGELPMLRAAGGSVGRIRPNNSPLSVRGGGMDDNAIRRIEAAVERGAAAQAPVQLFPTYDPVEAFERALSTPRGQKAMLDFAGSNSGKLNSQLQR